MAGVNPALKQSLLGREVAARGRYDRPLVEHDMDMVRDISTGSVMAQGKIIAEDHPTR